MEMEIIRDCLGRSVCKVNAADGTVETKYGKIRVLTRVAIGDSYCIERENVVTWVTRESETRFTVKSYPIDPLAA